MKKYPRFLFSAGLLYACLLSASQAAPRTYTANFTNAPPVIDGVVTAGEWDAASTVESGAWHMLRQSEEDIDAHDLRFRMLWDTQYLYVIIQTNYGMWQAPLGDFSVPFQPGVVNQGINFGGGADVINFYFDPNTDGEDTETRGDGQNDGYQFAWNLPEGTGWLRVDPEIEAQAFSNTAFYVENHIDGVDSGNSGRWQGPRKSKITQILGSTGGVIELAMAWEDVDSPNPEQWGEGEEMPADQGTSHPTAPANGDKWIMNFGRQTSDSSNFLPIWSWQPAQGFNRNPHGFLAFTGRPGATEEDFRITTFSRNATTGEITLTWNSATGKNYTVCWSDNPSTVETDLTGHTSIPGTGSPITRTFPPPSAGARFFFKVKSS